MIYVFSEFVKFTCILATYSHSKGFIVLFYSGYMPPEYAMEGMFSVKYDVFSFGVLMLEIVSGRKNNSFRRLNGQCNLVGYVSNIKLSSVHIFYTANIF